MTEQQQERWVSRQEVAEHLGVSIETVDRLVREGCPSVKLDPAPTGARRFRLSDVDEWLAGRNAPEPEAAA